MQDYGQEEGKAVFHGGFALIVRLDRIFWGLNEVTLEREKEQTIDRIIELWNNNYSLLCTLYKEISNKMSKKQRDRHETIRETLHKLLLDSMKCLKTGLKTRIDLLDYFDEWEMELRMIVEDKGLNMPTKNSMEDALQ